MKALVSALLSLMLLVSPVVAQDAQPEMPLPGAVVIEVSYYDGVDIVPYGVAVVPPLACSPVE